MNSATARQRPRGPREIGDPPYEPPLSTRACRACRRWQVSWLPGRPLRAFPSRRGDSVAATPAARAVGRSPVTVAGPRRILTGLPVTTDLELRADAYPARAMTVNLTRIYTKLGDGGETHLGDMSRVPKTHPRIEAYGDGRRAQRPDRRGARRRGPARALRRVAAPGPERPVRRRRRPLGARGRRRRRERLRVAPEQVEWLEAACDEVNADAAER